MKKIKERHESIYVFDVSDEIAEDKFEELCKKHDKFGKVKNYYFRFFRGENNKKLIIMHYKYGNVSQSLRDGQAKVFVRKLIKLI